MRRADHGPMPALDWQRTATRRLAEAGIESPELEARRLVAAGAGLTPLDLIRSPHVEVDAASLARLDAMLARRCAREPLSRILGHRDFYGRTFEVGPATLDPRPETETLVEAALQLADEAGWRGREIRMLDIGAGTGCIAITLLAELPKARAVAVDLSPAALAVAARNAARHGVAARVELIEGDLFEGIQGTFDLVVSNPPYVATGEICGLDSEVREHDPWLALDGGGDGLAVYRRIAGRVFDVIPCGWLVLEIGAGQRADVERLMHEAMPGVARHETRVWQDLGGIARVVAFRTRQ